MKTGIVCLMLLFVCAALAGPAFAEEPQPVKKAMIFQVKAGTIALPAGDVARVPISAARIRSTDLRDLNEKYNVVAIEKLYRAAPAPVENPPGSGSGGALRSTDKKESEEAPFDATQVLRREARKNLREKGVEVAEYPDAYLMEFALEPTVEMKDVVVAYWVLPAVTFVQEVAPEEE